MYDACIDYMVCTRPYNIPVNNIKNSYPFWWHTLVVLLIFNHPVGPQMSVGTGGCVLACVCGVIGRDTVYGHETTISGTLCLYLFQWFVSYLP